MSAAELLTVPHWITRHDGITIHFVGTAPDVKVYAGGSHDELYRVEINKPSCDCRAFQMGGGAPCKHVKACLSYTERYLAEWTKAAGEGGVQ